MFLAMPQILGKNVEQDLILLLDNMNGPNSEILFKKLTLMM